MVKSIFTSLLIAAISGYGLQAQHHDESTKSPNAPSQVAGYMYSENECASGGAEYFFYANGKALRDNFGDISVGTYVKNGNKVIVTLTDHYTAKGQGAPMYQGNSETYESYLAVLSKEKEVVEVIWSNTEDCTFYAKHSTSSDPSEWLKCSFKGKYAFTSERLVTASELAKYSKEELRIMRNEIFARYKYIFKSADLKKYFSEQKGYYGTFTDVNAFLSEIERKNVDTIKSVEDKK